MAAGNEEAAGLARVVLSTAPEGERAVDLARTLVRERVAACVNIVPGLTSVYAWKGAVEEEREALLVIKTSAERLPDLEALLKRIHGYDVPELVALEPAHVEPRYLAWLVAACERPAGGAP